MTLDQAKQIREWRVNDGCSWRRVAEKAAEMFPEIGIDSGNQIDGMYLCDDAMNMLGETVGDGWN